MTPTRIKLPAPFIGDKRKLDDGLYLYRDRHDSLDRWSWAGHGEAYPSYEYVGPLKLDIEEPMPEPDVELFMDRNPVERIDHFYSHETWMIRCAMGPMCSKVRVECEDKRTAIEMFNAAVKVLREAGQ